jgi:hypothetical protein
MRLPEKSHVHREIINLLIDNAVQTAQQIQSQVPRIFPYKAKGVEGVLHKMIDAGYLDRAGDAFCLTQATYDIVTGGKFKGSVAAPRICNVFAETTGAIAKHFANMRAAGDGRLA